MNTLLQKTVGAFEGWSDGPWRSKSVLAAVIVVVIGTGFWFHDVQSPPSQAQIGSAVTNTPGAAAQGAAVGSADSRWDWSQPLPFYVPAGASYVAGFCIGWFFRRVIRIIVALTALAVALLALGKFAGWDTTAAREQVKRGGEWTHHEVAALERYLKHLLPSAVMGGAGTLLGFRRRRKISAPEPAG